MQRVAAPRRPVTCEDAAPDPRICLRAAELRCEWLDQCQPFESAVDLEVYPSLADDEDPSDTDRDVLDATTDPLVVLASAMLLRLSTFG